MDKEDTFQIILSRFQISFKGIPISTHFFEGIISS